MFQVAVLENVVQHTNRNVLIATPLAVSAAVVVGGALNCSESMLNSQGTCHGGLIFTLADSAFAFACNAYNKVTVAQHCSVTFLAPAKLGDRLTARAEERSLNGRSGIYDIRVDNQDGKAIAEFRGHSRTIKGHLVPELAAEETT